MVQLLLRDEHLLAPRHDEVAALVEAALHGVLPVLGVAAGGAQHDGKAAEARLPEEAPLDVHAVAVHVVHHVH